MAGTPNGKLTSVSEAKSRLRALGERRPAISAALSSPAVRIGAIVLAGALLGRRWRRRDRTGVASALRRAVVRTGLAAAPLLAEHLVRHFAPAKQSRSHTTSDNGVPRAVRIHDPVPEQ